MTKIKLCGLSRPCDIETANRLLPEYIGFVFAPKSKRYVPPETAAALKGLLHPSIQAVGVFVREEPEQVARLLRDGIIDIAQLHGGEDAAYVRVLRRLTDRPILQAFRVDSAADVAAAQKSEADMILLDAGAGGTGTAFDWTLLRDIRRPYFLAGGLHPGNVREAMERLSPYAVDVSSGIETDKMKDREKMLRFAQAVAGAEKG